MVNNVLFEGDRIKVTNQRVVIGSTTYAVRNISSVTAERVAPEYGIGVAAAVIALVCILLALASFSEAEFGTSAIFLLIGLAFGLASYLIFKSKKPTFTLNITTNAQQISVLECEDRDFVVLVRDAIADAIDAED